MRPQRLRDYVLEDGCAEETCEEGEACEIAEGEGEGEADGEDEGWGGLCCWVLKIRASSRSGMERSLV